MDELNPTVREQEIYEEMELTPEMVKSIRTLCGRVPARSGSATWRDAPFKLPCAILAKHSRIF